MSPAAPAARPAPTPTPSPTGATKPAPKTDTGTSGSTGATASLTMSAVATHNSATSCWTVIDGNVYDLTEWIRQHPGGPQAIGKLCGRDGCAIFHGQHGNAQAQADILATFKLGALAQ